MTIKILSGSGEYLVDARPPCNARGYRDEARSSVQGSTSIWHVGYELDTRVSKRKNRDPV